MIIVFRYFKERLRFTLHNTRSFRDLLKKENLSEKDFEKLFMRLTYLNCFQMQLQLIKKHHDLVNKIIGLYKKTPEKARFKGFQEILLQKISEI